MYDNLSQFVEAMAAGLVDFEPEPSIYGTALYDSLVEAQQVAQEAQQ